MDKDAGIRIALGLVAILAVAAIVLLVYLRQRPSSGRPDVSSRQGASPQATKNKDDAEHRLVSVVLLLDRPRSLDDKSLAALATKTLGVSFEGESNDCFVVGESPMFILRMNDLILGIHNRSEPYVANMAKEAGKIVDPALREAFARHKAWLAVDLMEAANGQAPDVAYPCIAKVIGALVDGSVLAVYCPDSSRMRLCTGAFKAKMVGPNPMAAIGEIVPDQLIQVEGDDPEMKAAAEEARRRWPEFVDAFRNHAGKSFNVKVPLSEDTQK